MDTKTIITTAGKDAIAFGDFVSVFIVRHPKVSAILAFCIGAALSHIFWK